ncbi:lopap-like [Lutzomyia longipalpis]|uniref:Putative apolipoprotein d/lipocalin n=1 Tax=Lutzomyia longipalpis TaxID=7200 RepID=A0A1B0CES1_LUTLO|nr:lopap-like [Lutzomyia longipalpis]
MLQQFLLNHFVGGEFSGKMKVVLFVLALVGSSLGLIFDRECPGHSAVENFNTEQYQGVWYEVYRYETSEQYGSDCATFEYYATGADTMDLVFRWVYIENNFDELYRYGNAVREAGAAGSARFQVTFDDEPGRNINYQVLATDYDSFSLIWSCHNLGNGQSNEDAWVLSKIPHPDMDEFEQVVGGAIDAYLDRAHLRGTVQGWENCTDIPARAYFGLK